MFGNRIQLLSLVFLFNLMASTVMANTWTYRLPGFGFATGQNCTAALSSVAETFAKLAHVEVLGVGCVPPQIGKVGPSGEISYSSSSNIVITTSDVRVGWGSEGPYTSYAACLEGLKKERVLFVKNVGSEPFVEYCYQSNVFGQTTFRAHMDAVGDSLRKKFTTFGNWVGTLQNSSGIIEQVKNLSDLLKNDVVEAYIDKDTYGSRMSLDYYGDSQRYLLIKTRAVYDVASDCKTQRESLNSRWPNDKIATTFGCSQLPNSPAQLIQFWLSSEPTNESDISSVKIATVYSSLQACEMDRARVEQVSLKSNGQFLATLCSNGEQPHTAAMLVLSLF